HRKPDVSRIAGLCLGTTSQDGTGLSKAMTDRSRLGSEWLCRTAEIGRTIFAWCGWTAEANLSLRSALLAVVDGCIYNRSEVGAGDTDAATLVSLYSKYGFSEAISKLNGDFAAALYDARKETTWLARDRFGLKPLYYTQGSDFFAFASQPGALLALPGVSRDVNPQFVALFAASHYRYFDNQPERSPYRDIAQLPAAHVLSVHEGQI